MAIHGSEIDLLGMHAGNLWRLVNILGYPDSRVTSLTTVSGLTDDIRTFKDLVNPADREICEAACDTVNWMAANDLLTDTIVTALTTVYDITVSATTDLSYNIRGLSAYPSASYGSTPDAVTVAFPAH
jgi:hypothetical protein